MKKNTNICIIGAGAMGSSVVSAIAKVESSWKLTVIDSHDDKLQDLKKTCPHIITSKEYESISSANIIILAVKPQSFNELAGKIKSLISKDVLIISIMAGQSVSNITKELKVKKVVRAMPNLGARFSESMTIWFGKNISTEDKSFVEILFSKMGEQIEVSDEDFIDKSTAVSGSGVGFFAYLIEEYITQTIKLGFSSIEANKIVLQTLKATNTLLQNKDKSPEQLRKDVTSKGGTTEAGLTVLMDKNLSKIFSKTFKKAYLKAKKLSK